MQVFQCKKKGRYNGEICAQQDKAEVYRWNLGFLVENSSERIRVLILKQVLDQRSILKSGFKVDEWLVGVSKS